MKTALFTSLAAALLTALGAQAQSPITLTNAGYATSGTDTLATVSNLSAYTNLGTPATNGSWDLSAAAYLNSYTIQRTTPPASGNPFPNASYYQDVRYSFAGGALSYDVQQYYQNTNSGILEVGEYSPTPTPIFIGLVTGDPGDSLVFEAQTIPYLPSFNLIKFPATMSSSWSTQATRSNTRFTLTVAMLALDHVAGERRASRAIHDTVIGWGQMRVAMEGGGASEWIPVLQVRHSEDITDSFYLGGVPASSALLGTFGLAQGQVTSSYETRFYRASDATPLVTVTHDDNTFSGTPADMTVQTTRLAAASVKSVGNVANVSIYPNPAHGTVNVTMTGNTTAGWHYALVNMVGQQVAGGALALHGSQQAAIQLPAGLSAGVYGLKLFCSKGAVSATLTVK
jgi:hypothetical protein